MSDDVFRGMFESSADGHAVNREAEAILKSEAVIECFLCDDHGYRGHYVCDHIDHGPATRRGMELVRQALAKGRQS